MSKNFDLVLSSVLEFEGILYQFIEIKIAEGAVLEPSDLRALRLPTGIEPQVGVVISGRAPIWLYAYLVHELHPTAWVACYDPRIGAIVVTTHSRLVKVGQILKITA